MDLLLCRLIFNFYGTILAIFQINLLFFFQKIRVRAAVRIVTVGTHFPAESVVDIYLFPLFSFNQLFDVIMAFVTGLDAPFLDHWTVVFSMAEDAGWLLIMYHLFEHAKVVVMIIFAFSII